MLYLFAVFILLILTIQHSFPVTRILRNPSIKVTTCSTISSNGQSTLDFGNCFNNLYYINLNVGTPSQTIAVHFDTGSNTLWVPTQQVTGITPIFNTTLSSTFVNTSSVGSVQVIIS